MPAPALALESLKPLRIRGKHVGQELQRDIAPELGVPRPVHLAHAAGADGGEDLVRAEVSAGGEGHGPVDYTGA